MDNERDSSVMLEEYICNVLERLNESPNGDELKAQLNALSVAYDLKLKEEELLDKRCQENQRLDIEEAKFRKSIADDAEKSKTHWVDVGLKVADVALKAGIVVFQVVVPLRCYTRCFCEGLKFEETGVVGSTFVKNHLNQLKPIRK